MMSAIQGSKTKCFFVGRRGTGKTATTYYVLQNQRQATQIIPQLFDVLRIPVSASQLTDTRQRPFKSLVSSFHRALEDEVIAAWLRHGKFSFSSAFPAINRERNYIENYDFDLRVLAFVEEIFTALAQENPKEWYKQINRVDAIASEMTAANVAPASGFTILIDRIDEAWSGTDESVILLMGLMHACVQMCAHDCPGRPLLFLRENIFERVRQLDNEFARLETAVVGLDWSYEQLREMVERRLSLPFNTRLPLGGPTWAHFFEGEQKETEKLVFDFCQRRPRDVLIYCGFAVAAAQSHQHEKICQNDLREAQRRFSDSRLKDLGDEYSENYPNLNQVLRRFYGLGRMFALTGLEAFIKKLLLDENIKKCCATWIFRHTTPDLFITLFYNIGFFGLETGSGPRFRGLGPKTTTPPPITADTVVQVHPTYWEALNLQDDVVITLPDDRPLQVEGLLNDLPTGTTLEGYQEKLAKILEDLNTLPTGREHAAQFEDIIGEIIRLCFFRSLVNVEPRQRDVDGVVVRDWIAGNRASDGFWLMVQNRYASTQIVWECKNFDDLGADVFQQAAYYMTKEIGRFVVVAFRGHETKRHCFQHVKRVASDKEGGIILLVNQRDLMVFLRQAINGKIKEEHIYELFDRSIRAIS
jgi:hypothetical protein